MEKTKKVADMTSKEIDEYLKKFLDEYNATHEDVEDTEDDVDEYVTMCNNECPSIKFCSSKSKTIGEEFADDCISKLSGQVEEF